MPIMDAKRESPCAACGQMILLGERIEYVRARGARHLACTDVEAGQRRNGYEMPCNVCGEWLRKGKGTLECIETQRIDGTFARKWLATCVDVAGCNGRSAGLLTLTRRARRR